MARKTKYSIGNFTLQVKRSATGKGLFAVDPIPKGTCIIEYTGTPVSERDQYKINSKYLFDVGRKQMINGNIPSNTARYINHSCKPNCEADGPSGKVYILSIKKIKAGEELTYDYGKEYFDEYLKPKGCRCVKCVK
jgi:SET domain-containing protein